MSSMHPHVPYAEVATVPAPVPAFIRDQFKRYVAEAPTVPPKAREWAAMPKPFKVMILKKAGLDPLRECMPLGTFSEGEKIDLGEAARKLHTLCLQLMKVTS
jgi:hypothetical protein